MRIFPAEWITVWWLNSYREKLFIIEYGNLYYTFKLLNIIFLHIEKHLRNRIEHYLSAFT